MTFTIPAQAQDVEMAEASTSAQPQPALRPLTLPVYLQRPAFKGIAKDTLAAIDPELRDVQPQYIRDQLANLGSSMVQTVCSVKAAPITGALPKTMPIHVTDCASEPPTHMLGIYANTPLPNESVGAAAAPKQKVTLFPAHDVVLASYCANLPILPRGNDQGTSTPSPDGVKTALDITLPIIPFCIPSPSTFAPLLRFMYTRDPTALQRTLFPCALPTSHIDIFDSAQEGAAGLRVDFAKRIADTYRGQVLMRHVMVIQGMWRNVCVLGIEDKAVWDTIDAAWNVMVLAVAIALKDTASMTAMVGGKERAEELALL
ncbi:hypothetical protein BDV98DRAFT_497779 [Pterulicium gracile]|uniref:Clp1-like protein n=1 Tax=Pterulicium gracile TaxID=1884261 RepID=A0A5C3R222_9AGAR|nr:hypothetical protein BDV98DRAFT_497779 [Pterula gracilis]